MRAKGTIRRVCTACLTDFFVPPSRVAKGEAKYCSMGCYLRHRWDAYHAAPPSLEQKFLGGFSTGEGCWLWNGSFGHAGYGRIHISANGANRKVYAHRYAWERVHGPIPSGMQVCHHCDVRACVRIDHLFLGTIQDNLNDMRAKGRHARGEMQGAARLTEANVREIRRMVASGTERKAVALQFGITPRHVGKIVTRTQWAHVQ